jgi:molybdopterin/thiamine biosynthesis adenylyltransferase
MQPIDTHPDANVPEDERAFRDLFLDRSLPFLTSDGSALLKTKKIGIAGCGGVGGVAVVTLARMGARRLHLADPGSFDLPDLNRQWCANTTTLGKNKARVYRDAVRDIDPFAEVRIWEEGIRPDNVDHFLEGVDLLVDCLDLAVPLSLRAQLCERAHRKGIFTVTAPILGFATLVVCSDPKGMPMTPFLDLLQSVYETRSLPGFLYDFLTPEHLDLMNEWLSEKGTKVPSIGVAPLLSGSLTVTEVMAALIGTDLPGGRPPITLPRIILFDSFRMKYGQANLLHVMQPAAV